MNARQRRPGTILVVTMLIVFTLASMVLVICSSMRVEATAAANMAASLQASTVERGAEQYVIALLTEQKDTLADLTEDYFQQVPVGDSFFWIVRPDYDDTSLPLFGLTEENAKLNVNNASNDSLMKLPYMTDDVATAIVSWRGGAAAGSTGSGGSPDQYYASLGYQSKQGAFESVEELLLLRGMNRQMLYGDGTAPPLGVRSNYVTSSTGTNDMIVARGWFNYLTVYSTETAAAGQKVNVNNTQDRQPLNDLLTKQLNNAARVQAIMGSLTRNSNFVDLFDFAQQTTMKSSELDLVYDSLVATPAQGGAGGGAAGGAAAATKVVGRVNVNVAPREVLMCLPGLESAEVEKLIAARASNQPGTTTVGWVLDALQQKARGLGTRITGKSSQYSADIVAVTGNGRAFKRVRIVVDASGTTPQITYRRDLTDRGWPMDPQILASLRAGQQLDTTGSTTGNVGRGMSAGGSFR